MSPVSVEVPNLVAGVSQQPPKTRRPGKLEEATNVWLDPALGAIRRPSSFHVVTTHTGSAPPARRMVPIDLNGEIYFALIREEEIVIFDDTGTQVLVRGPHNGAKIDLRYLDRQAYGENYLDSVRSIFLDWTVVAGTVGYETGVNPGPFTDPDKFDEFLTLTTDGGGGSRVRTSIVLSPRPTTRVGHRCEFFVRVPDGKTGPDDFLFTQTFRNSLDALQIENVRWDWDGADWTVGASTANATGFVLELDNDWWRLRMEVNPDATFVELSDHEIEIQTDGIGVTRDLVVFQPRDSEHDPSLAALDPALDLQTLTVQDFTFILNRLKQTALKSKVAEEVINAGHFVGDDPAFIGCQFSNQTTYHITWKTSADATTFTVSHSTGTGVGDSDIIANVLRIAFDAAGSTADSKNQGSTLLLDPGVGNTFDSLEVRDSLGDTLLKLVWEEVENISDLPLHAPNGFVVRIAGSPGSPLDDYYVKFEEASDPEATGALEATLGIWRETVKPGVSLGLDEITMPYQLVRRFDDAFGTATGTAFERYFEWSPVAWVDRETGDDVINAPPSFIGEKLTDIAFHRNRLAFSAVESAVLSEAAFFFNFWRTTTTAVVDSDPIDAAASHTERSDVRHMVSSDQVLLLISDETTFALSSGGQVLSPATVTIRPILKLDVEPTAAPVLFGAAAVIAGKADPTSSVHSVFQRDIDLWDSADLTQDVPSYIDTAILEMLSAPGPGFLLVRTATKTRVWFSARDPDGKAIQAAWSSWEWPFAVKGVGLVDDDLWLLAEDTNDQWLVRLPLDPSRVETGKPWSAHLDARVTPSSAVYAVGPDETTVTLGRTVLTDDVVVNLANGDALKENSRTATTIVVAGDASAFTLTVGADFKSNAVLTPPYPKLPSSLGGFSARRGRFQISFCRVDVEDTNHVQALVDMTGRVQGKSDYRAPELLLGDVNLADDVFRFLVQGNPDDALRVELRSTGHLQFRLVAAAWEGEFYAGTGLFGSA